MKEKICRPTTALEGERYIIELYEDDNEIMNIIDKKTQSSTVIALGPESRLQNLTHKPSIDFIASTYLRLNSRLELKEAAVYGDHADPLAEEWAIASLKERLNKHFRTTAVAYKILDEQPESSLAVLAVQFLGSPEIQRHFEAVRQELPWSNEDYIPGMFRKIYSSYPPDFVEVGITRLEEWLKNEP